MERHVDAPPWRTFGTYVLLVIGFSWSVWFAGLPRATGTERTLVVLLGAWGPTLVAVALTARRDGRPGVRSLLAGLVRWRVAARWYAVALMTVPVSALLAASVGVMFVAFQGEWELGGQLTLAGLALFGFGYYRYRQTKAVLAEKGEEEQGESEGSDRNG